MTYAARNRRRIDWGRLILLFLILVLAAAGLYFGSRLFRKEKLPASLKSANEKCVSVTEVSDRFLIAAYYPEEVEENVKENLKAELNRRIEIFKVLNQTEEVPKKEERPVFFCDYQKITDGSVFSYLFLEKQGKDIQSLEDAGDFVLVYDSEKKQEVSLDSLFENDYMAQIAALFRRDFLKSEYAEEIDKKAFYQATQKESELYSRFIIVGNSLRFYFPSSSVLKEDRGEIYQDIPLAELDFCLKEDLSVSSPVLATEDTSKRLRYIDVNKPMIALTYDDGPYGPVTERLLNALKKVDGVATFFVVGSRVNWRVNAGMLERAVAEGSEIGCHTYNHHNLTKMTAQEIKKEIQDTVKVIEDKLEGYTVKSVRPVGGAYNDTVKANAGYVLYNWSVDSLDWKTRNKDAILEKVRSEIEDGDIVLMHDLYETTADASEVLIPELAKTYQLLTVTELMEYKGVEVKAGDVVLSPMKKIR